MDTRADRPHSPSARFYANRQSEGPRIFDMLPHPDPEQQPRPQLSPPFSDFQGFSAPPSSHRYNNDTGVARMSDERVSPRTMVSYHDHQNWPPSRKCMERLSNETDHMPSTSYSSTQHHVGLVHTHTHHHDLSGPGRARQLSEPPTYTPPPQTFSSPENAPAPAFAESYIPVILPPRGAPVGPLPITAQHPVLGGNTIRAPSNSDASDAGQQPQGLAAVGRSLTTNENDQSTSVPSSDDDDANSTVYPYDSTSVASSSAASRAAGGGGISHGLLEAAIVEVHNTCLASTQRYLESLRVNWELRHGRETLPPPGLAGPTRRLYDRGGARGSPYSLLRRNRRALSKNSGLEYMRGMRRGNDKDDEGKEGRIRGRQLQPPACPIPPPTDSLLQNTSRICELIWRRARRDCDDVLGAEVFGTRHMGLLVECAEAVVLHDAAEWEVDPQKSFFTACQAGRKFCRKLGDLRGVGRVESIERGEIQLGRSVEEGEV